MKVGETNYFKVVKSLGKLQVCGISALEARSSQFGMKLTKLDEFFNYGTCHIYQIELFNEGRFDDLKVGDNLVSYLVKSELTTYKSVYTVNNKIRLQYQDRWGACEEFQLNFNAECEDGAILLKIVYILILLAEFSNSDLCKKLVLILNKRLHDLSTGTLIDCIKALKDILPVIKEKYPFVADEVEDAMKKVREKVKEDLYNAAVL